MEAGPIHLQKKKKKERKLQNDRNEEKIENVSKVTKLFSPKFYQKNFQLQGQNQIFKYKKHIKTQIARSEKNFSRMHYNQIPEIQHKKILTVFGEKWQVNIKASQLE